MAVDDEVVVLGGESLGNDLEADGTRGNHRLHVEFVETVALVVESMIGAKDLVTDVAMEWEKVLLVTKWIAAVLA